MTREVDAATSHRTSATWARRRCHWMSIVMRWTHRGAESAESARVGSESARSTPEVHSRQGGVWLRRQLRPPCPGRRVRPEWVGADRRAVALRARARAQAALPATEPGRAVTALEAAGPGRAEGAPRDVAAPC